MRLRIRSYFLLMNAHNRNLGSTRRTLIVVNSLHCGQSHALATVVYLVAIHEFVRWPFTIGALVFIVLRSVGIAFDH